jgi:hypothetical protein
MIETIILILICWLAAGVALATVFYLIRRDEPRDDD